MTTRPQLDDIVAIGVPGLNQPYRISDDRESHDTYRLELVNAGGPADCGINGSAFGRALGPHYVLTPNGPNDDDPTVPGGNGNGIIVPVQIAVVSFRRALPNHQS